MTEKELFDKVISGIDSQDWEDTGDHYRYAVDDENGYSDRRSPLGWIMTDDEHQEMQNFSASRISAYTPRLQRLGRIIFELEQAWTAKKWRDGYSGFRGQYHEKLKEHRRAAIYGVGRFYGLVEAQQ
jgi:hypothetical protein